MCGDQEADAEKGFGTGGRCTASAHKDRYHILSHIFPQCKEKPDWVPADWKKKGLYPSEKRKSTGKRVGKSVGFLAGENRGKPLRCGKKCGISGAGMRGSGGAEKRQITLTKLFAKKNKKGFPNQEKSDMISMVYSKNVTWVFATTLQVIPVGWPGAV